MTLNETQIQAIDTYLKNSEIEFVDVRMEMLDQVASALEHKMKSEKLDFYKAFKNYMVLHKKQLQKQNKQFTKTTDIKVLKAIGTYTIKPISLLTFVLCFLALKMTSNYIDLAPFLKFAPIAFITSIFIFYFSMIFRFGKKERYSGIERMTIITSFVTQIINSFLNPWYGKTLFGDYENLSLLFVSYLLILGMALVATLLQLKKEYTERYTNKLA